MIRMPGPDLNVTRHSLTDAEMTRDYAVTPTPVMIFRAELNESTLPGPRHIAFGPSVIGLFIDLRVLAMIFAVVFISLVVWFIGFRKGGGGENNNGNEE